MISKFLMRKPGLKPKVTELLRGKTTVFLKPILLSPNHMTFSSTEPSCYNNAFFLFMFLRRLKIVTAASGMYKYNLLQERQVASMHVILQRQTVMCTWEQEGRFLWTSMAGAGPAHESEAAHRVSRISSGYKRL